MQTDRQAWYLNPWRLLRSPMALMTVGLGLVVLSGFVFTATVTRVIAPDPRAALTGGLYFLVNTLALGVFSGVEQETSRSVSQERAGGGLAAPVTLAATRQALRLLALAVGLLLATSPILVAGPLRGHWELVAELAVALFSACCAAVVRGALAGSQRFGLYSATMATEGLSRIVPCVLLLLFGVHSPWMFGLFFVLGQGFAALVGVVLLRLSGVRGWQALPQDGASPALAGVGTIRFGVSTALLLVVLANLTNQAIVNLPPVVGNARLANLPLVATAIAGAVTLTRLPMFAFVPLQTVLLPKLTDGAARREFRTVRKQTERTIAACVLLGVIGIVLLGLIGPQVLATYLGSPALLTGASMAGLGVGTLFLMTTNVTQPALLALTRHRAVLLSYLTGLAALIVAWVLPLDPVASVVLSASVGPMGTAIVMLIVLFKATSRESSLATR